MKPKDSILKDYYLSKLPKQKIIDDQMGQWAHPGEVTRIQGNTMATHGYGNIPLYVVPDNDEPRMVYPNTGDHMFPNSSSFTEYPIMKKGGSLTANKAREILHDKEVHGHPLTDKQRKFFGAMSKGNTMKYKTGGWIDDLPKFPYGGVADYFKQQNLPFDFKSRKALYEQSYGEKYKGSMSQNTKWLNDLSSNTTPSPRPEMPESTIPIPISVAPKSKKKTRVIVGDSMPGGIQESALADPYYGETLVKDEMVGNIQTKLKDFNFRAPYRGELSGIITKSNCPEGVGCAEQSVDAVAALTGVPRKDLSPFDAAYRNSIFKREGAQEVWYPKEHKKYDPTTLSTSSLNPVPKQLYKDLKIGDFVGLTKPSATGMDYTYLNSPAAKARGLSNKDVDAARHWGEIVGFEEDGTPLVRHGWAMTSDATGKHIPNKGKFRVDRLDDVKIGSTKWYPLSIQRPKIFSGSDNAIVSNIPVKNSAQRIAMGKQNTTSAESFYLGDTKEEKLQKEMPVAAEFSGANTRLATKKKLVSLFNDKKLDNELKFKLGLTQKELNNLKPLFYGMVGQESNFQDIDNLGRSLKEIFGNSLGPAQIKFSSLTSDEKKTLGLKSEDDLYDINKAYKAGILLLNNARKQMNRQVEMGTHPGLKDADEYWRALYFYNSPHRAINTAADWGKQSNPIPKWYGIPYNPKTWLNKLSTRERPGIFASVIPNYVEKNELRMDKGSYPYKVRQAANDLEVVIDEREDNPQTLDEVIVKSFKRKPGQKFIPKEQIGGWLDKYQFGGSDPSIPNLDDIKTKGWLNKYL